jgi:small subunit ribosomal protein S15
MALAKTKKKEIISKYKISKNDSGSDEVQIALLTERINGLSGHFGKNVKDNHSRYGLIKMVSRRKRLLKHLQSETPEKYQQIIARLDLRK